MQRLFNGCAAFFIVCYAFEAVIRWLLNMVGMDAAIFARDAVLMLGAAGLVTQQVLFRRLHPAVLVYVGIVSLHGLVFYLNFGLLSPVAVGAKALFAGLAGALAARFFMNPTERVWWFFMGLWLISVAAVGADKYFQAMPWVGMKANIGGLDVEIARDWEISGAAYRAGGLMRSSINCASLVPLLALLVFSQCRSVWLRAVISIGTIGALYCTTQKGSLLAFIVVTGALWVGSRMSVVALRGAFLVFMLLMVLLPIVLVGYHMPDEGGGVFSSESFFMRVEGMWPAAWKWIEQHELFPFGVGLGGIGGAQQMYSREHMNAADNLFVFMYAYFGLMALVYLALMLCAYFAVPRSCSPSDRNALAMLLQIVTYGIAISILDDGAGAFFLGVALSWIAYERKRPPDAGITRPTPKAERLPRWRSGTVKARQPPAAGEAASLPAPVTASQSPDVLPP